MANWLEQDITGKIIELHPDAMAPAYKSPANRLFLVEGGFGAKPHTEGKYISVYCPLDGLDEGFRNPRIVRTVELAEAEEILRSEGADDAKIAALHGRLHLGAKTA